MQRHVEHKQGPRKPPRKKKENRERRDTVPVAPRTDDGEKPQGEGLQPGEGSRQIEGEGNYTAGRRYDKAAREFVQSGAVERSAREAANDLADDELLEGGAANDDDADTHPGYRH